MMRRFSTTISLYITFMAKICPVLLDFTAGRGAPLGAQWERGTQTQILFFSVHFRLWRDLVCVSFRRSLLTFSHQSFFAILTGNHFDNGKFHNVIRFLSVSKMSVNFCFLDHPQDQNSILGVSKKKFLPKRPHMSPPSDCQKKTSKSNWHPCPYVLPLFLCSSRSCRGNRNQ